MAKRIRTRRIRANRTYDVAEAAKVCGVTVWSVRNWIRQGLPVLDGQRPTLIIGEALKAFHINRAAMAKRPLKNGELYCTTCKAATRPLAGEFDVKHYGKRLAVQAFCADCERLCSRFVSNAQLAAFAKESALPSLGHAKPKGTGQPLLKSIQGGRTI